MPLIFDRYSNLRFIESHTHNGFFAFASNEFQFMRFEWLLDVDCRGLGAPTKNLLFCHFFECTSYWDIRGGGGELPFHVLVILKNLGNETNMRSRSVVWTFRVKNMKI